MNGYDGPWWRFIKAEREGKNLGLKIYGTLVSPVMTVIGDATEFHSCDLRLKT
jgi:hypothetical protein